MIFYFASILFCGENNGLPMTNDYPLLSSSKSYSSLEAFADYCKLNAKENDCWSWAWRVSINLNAATLNESGTFNLLPVHLKIRSINKGLWEVF